VRRRHRRLAAAATWAGHESSAVDVGALEGWDKLFLRKSGCEAIWRKSSSGRNHDSATAGEPSRLPNWIFANFGREINQRGKAELC